MPDGWLDIIKMIVGSVVVIAAAYYTTYYIATRKGKGAPGREVRLRENFALSKDKSICLFEVRDKIYLVAVTNGGATVLDTYDTAVFADEPLTGAADGASRRGPLTFLDSFRRGRKADFAASLRRAGADEIIGTYADMEDAPSGPSFAREEDGIDEVFRRLQSRMTAAGRKEEDESDA